MTPVLSSLTPLGADALQAWASHCFQAAFTIGIGVGMLWSVSVPLGVLTGRKVWNTGCALWWDWRHRQAVKEWEAGPEAAALAAYHDACDLCAEEEHLRASVIELAGIERNWREYRDAHGITEGAPVDTAGLHAWVYDDGADDVRAEYGRLYKVQEEEAQ